ncbi:MAG TPA: DinB family protein [Pyrinomonadaceae bacterium]|jgi:uncharacterized damage-inducible protein DinB
MTETERILDQLKRAYKGGAWHGPSVRETLAGLSAEIAAARPISAAHSIWEVVLHIAAWQAAVGRRLGGDRAQLPTEEDWPVVIETSEAAWSEAKKALDQSHDSLVAAVSGLDETRLDEPILTEMPSIYVTLHGVIQHDLYHAGQIAILKKALGIAS